MNNLGKTGNFCERDKLPMITQDEIDNLNSHNPKSITQIEIVVKNFYIKKPQIHIALLMNSTEHLRKK